MRLTLVDILTDAVAATPGVEIKQIDSDAGEITAHQGRDLIYVDLVDTQSRIAKLTVKTGAAANLVGTTRTTDVRIPLRHEPAGITERLVEMLEEARRIDRLVDEVVPALNHAERVGVSVIMGGPITIENTVRGMVADLGIDGAITGDDADYVDDLQQRLGR